MYPSDIMKRLFIGQIKTSAYRTEDSNVCRKKNLNHYFVVKGKYSPATILKLKRIIFILQSISTADVILDISGMKDDVAYFLHVMEEEE